MYDLLFAFGLWTLASIIMGMEYLHLSLMDRIPLLWQIFVPIILLAIGLSLGNLQSALRGIAYKTPWHWLVFFQALRIGAIGGVMKGVRGEVTSSFVFWVGGPDFLFGLSALVVGWLVLRKAVGKRFLLVWNLVGAAIILVPTFVFMPYWMNEPGFSFIFELPMVLAPSIVVPILWFSWIIVGKCMM